MTVRSCTIITTAADIGIGEIHDRMPVILDDKDVPAWLGDETIDDPGTLLQSSPAARLSIWPVSKAVGNVKNQGAELAEAIMQSV